MPSQNTGPDLDMRALLESTGTPFVNGRYPPGSVIFLQGDACESVMHVESGRVRLAVTASDGKEAICGLVETGAFLGEEALSGRATRRETATAMTATEVLVVATAQMIQLARTQPVIADRVVAHVLRRQVRLVADLADQLLSSSEQRLARTLVLLADCDGGGGCRCALPDVSQEIIAEMVGTTRSRVNVFMGRLKKRGFLEEDRGVLRITPSLVHLVHAGLGVSQTEHHQTSSGR